MASVIIESHRKFFPKKNLRLFIIIFLVIFTLSNIPEIGTTKYEARQVIKFCHASLNSPCPPAPECPPHCTYSTELRSIFWPLIPNIKLNYGPTSEKLQKIPPIIELLKFKTNKINDLGLITDGMPFKNYIGLIIYLALTVFYWHLISLTLTLLITNKFKISPVQE